MLTAIIPPEEGGYNGTVPIYSGEDTLTPPEDTGFTEGGLEGMMVMKFILRGSRTRRLRGSDWLRPFYLIWTMPT
jgi:hypothetical protein